MKVTAPTDRIISYYRTLESRLIYALLRGEKRFGYHPEGQARLSMREAQRRMIDKLGGVLQPEAGWLVLDAGCGEGSVALRLAGRYDVRVMGVDVLDFNIRRARRKAARSRMDGGVSFAVADYTDLGFHDGTFDAVYTMESLVHAPDHRRALEEFRRVLKPGGKLVLFEYSMPSAANMTARQREIADLINDESAMYSLPAFTHGSFPRILREAGFEDIEVEDITPHVMPVLRKMYLRFLLPYALISRLKLQRRFVNATAVVETYRNIGKGDVFRYNVVTAIRSV